MTMDYPSERVGRRARRRTAAHARGRARDAAHGSMSTDTILYIHTVFQDARIHGGLLSRRSGVLLDLRATLNSSNNGNISAAFSDRKHRGWNSSATLAKALSELRALGFIAVTRQGGLKMGTRVCSLYRFTDLPVYDQPKVDVLATPATYDFLRFKSKEEAQRARDEGMKKLRAEGAKKQMPKKKSLCSQNLAHRFRVETGNRHSSLHGQNTANVKRFSG
ncbi:hypothetical protein L0Z42_06560 [Burkholderia multivorans]|uniref:hypothetical protein n=1 Tax=Burkholderia multivorans TaxID=87883 RepID=UPI00201966F1|nr:hypothetical protein [Burkholderia multivorans]MCO1370235.1 hypothetical protein [Burkholderia multivorans]MCO1459534.1 hypothetical protein [Burkholderia multivorans]MCO1467501.1 hypothetical protein [Burkholderia multivorans]UQO20714.1 hypothetical protein L0Z02_27545 [Burkholderia multivorans]